MTHDSSLLRNYYSHAASPCRGGASARPWRDRVVAAFIWPVAKPLHGSQVRRGHLLISSLPALLSRARETWPETICLASQRPGNLATGGAQTAPGCAAAYSLTRRAAPAFPISHDLSAPSCGASQDGKHEGYRRPLHRNARRLPLIPNYTRDFPCVGLRRDAGNEQPRALVRGKTRGKSLDAQDHAPHDALRSSTPRPHGGAMRQGEYREYHQRARPARSRHGLFLNDGN